MQSNQGFNQQGLFKSGYNINMGYGQATSLYAILYHAICSNQSGRSEQPDSSRTLSVFLNTPRGERKLPEYAYSQITTNLKLMMMLIMVEMYN